MQTITKSYEVYTFDELSDEAKENALQEFQNVTPYFWADDAIASLKAFANAINITIDDYEIDFYSCSHSSIKTSNDDHAITNDQAARDIKKDGEAMKFTGYCLDADLADGFYKEYLNGERNAGALFRAAFDSLLEAAQKDVDYQYSIEGFADFAEVNEYQFLADGSLFNE